MPITKLNTFEGVPLGKENFEDYTSYLSNLVAKSNPFIDTDASDYNDIIVLGANQEQQVYASDSDPIIYNFYNNTNINNINGINVPYAFMPYDSSDSIEAILGFDSIITSDVLTINPTTSATAGVYFVKVEIDPDSEGADLQALLTINNSDVAQTDPFYVDLSTISTREYFYSTIYASDDSNFFELDVNVIGGSDGGFNFDVSVYKTAAWEQGYSYVINYKVEDLTFISGLTGRLNVYFGDANVLTSTDYSFDSFTLIDSVEISANNNTLGSLLFKPDQTYETGSIIFALEDDSDFEAITPVEVAVYKLTDDNAIALSGTTVNSYAFITDSENSLNAFSTNLIQGDYSTPNLAEWEIPVSSIEEIIINSEIYGYGYPSENLPVIFSKFVSSDGFGTYESAKSDTTLGLYEKGVSLLTFNGIPQIGDDFRNIENFYDVEALKSSDVLILNSLRFGAEYPEPRYSIKPNHQYANEVIEGFSYINAEDSSQANSLSNNNFDNVLHFPFTDFLLNPTIILVHFDASENLYNYYYVPLDTDFSETGNVKRNHYKIEDTSSGRIRFNFSLPIRESNDKFWIVSAEQLSETLDNDVVNYVPRYGNLYSPTENFDVTTKILSFDENLLLNTNLDASLPQLQLIPSTKIIASSGGPIISDSEGEFTRRTIFAFSYPAKVDVTELINIQAVRYEPDILKFFYYPVATAEEFPSTSTPYPVYVHIEKNDVSWFNRGINRLAYDPVSRAVNSQLHVVGNLNTRPADSATIGELKRRSTLSSLVGVIDETDTNFADNLNPNTFLISDSRPKITSVNAGQGSLLVGSGPSTEPRELTLGNEKDVLTVVDGDAQWKEISTAAWTVINAREENNSYSFTSTDKSILDITAATDQLTVSMSEVLNSTDYQTNIVLGLASDVSIYNLTVENNVDLPNTGVIPTDYGSSTSIPTFNVDEDGRITAATDIVIDTNAWTTITSGVNSVVAGITETLYFEGKDNQVEIIPSDVAGSDVIFFELSSDVFIDNVFSSKSIILNQVADAPYSTDGAIWSTSSDVRIILEGDNREIAIVDYHTHNASDINRGTLLASVGGTGYNSGFSNGELLIGNSSTGQWSKNTLTVSNGINVVNGPGSVQLSTNASSSNQINTIVSRDSNGDFSARNVTADLIGNANTATILETARTINGIEFDGSADINIGIENISMGFGLLSSDNPIDGLEATTVYINKNQIVTIADAQTITGAKTFQTLILPVKS